jgi:two-component system response regulator FixJ
MIGIMHHPAGADEPPALIVLAGAAEISAAMARMRLTRIEIVEHSRVPARVLDALARSHAAQTAEAEARVRVDALSERQREILAAIVRGCANKTIAWELGLSVRTVESYRAQLFARLGVRNSVAAVRLALAAGLGGEG